MYIQCKNRHTYISHLRRRINIVIYYPTIMSFYHIAIKGGGRLTRRLPHAKNAAYYDKVVFICWVDYAQEGSAFILSKCDFSRMFHTEKS